MSETADTSKADTCTCKWCSRPPAPNDTVCEICRTNMAAMSSPPMRRAAPNWKAAALALAEAARDHLASAEYLCDVDECPNWATWSRMESYPNHACGDHVDAMRASDERARSKGCFVGGQWAERPSAAAVRALENAIRAVSELDLKRAAVSFIEREIDGRILCVWNKRYAGWSMPGGLVEEGETPEEAQRRELLEETGLTTLAIWPMHEGPAAQLPDGANRARYVHVFRVHAPGEPREMEVGCPVTWLTRAEFLRWSPFRDIYAPIFERLDQQRKGA